MSDAETLRVYAAKAKEYADLTNDAARQDPLLAAFIAALPVGAHVLDLGCGPGQYAGLMAKAGLRVTATDAVAEMVEQANTHPDVTALQARFDEISGVDLYDGVWANFSLLHAPRADLPIHLTAIHKALKAGGRFHIAMKMGTGNIRDTIGRSYTYITDLELTHLLQDAGFTITDRTSGRDKGLDGTYANWLAVTAYG